MSRWRAMAMVGVAVVAPLATPANGVGAASPIRGSGSTFPQVALEQWAADVFGELGLSVDYSGNGSLGGLQNFQDGIVDFAATDVPYPDGWSTSRPYAYLPIVASGIALPYNLEDPAGEQITDLRLSPELIALVFFGTIRNWRDPAILAENPDLVDRLPYQEVRLAVRTPGAGTTEALTDYLSTVAPTEWEDFLARSSAPGFNCWCSAFPGSAELANYVAQDTPGSDGAIGYLEAPYAIQVGLPVVRVQNSAGLYRAPDARSVAIALLEATENPDGTPNLEAVHLSLQREAYPISSYTYLVVPTGTDFPAAKGETLSAYIVYSVTEGQEIAAPLGYAPLTPNLVQLALDKVALINGHVDVPPLGNWGRAYERLPTDLPPSTGIYVADYADATFSERGTELRVAPGEIDDQGTRTEELEIELTATRCTARTLLTTDVSTLAAAPDLGDIVVDARAGNAHVAGTFTLTGTFTTTPAGRGCGSPDPSRAVTTPMTLPVTLDVGWRNERGSVPEIYSGSECGGDGTCYVRAASARASWSSAAGAGRARSTTGFFFEGTYVVDASGQP